MTGRGQAEARRQAIIAAQPGHPDHNYGRPGTCDRCGAPVHRALWLGLDLDLEPTPLRIDRDLTTNRRGVMQWHPLPIGEWCGLPGPRNRREVREMHLNNCPARNTA